VKREDNTS